MEFQLKDIRPNPFRNIDRYPIRRDKVETLKESMQRTGYWGNILARKLKDGTAEIAYAHHRMVALRELFKPSDKVDLIIQDLDDDAMLQIMARENMEEWGTSAAIEQETIRAVVEAFAAGRIHLEAPEPATKKSLLRYAPSFLVADEDRGAPRDRPYTAQTVGSFIGWIYANGTVKDKVKNTLTALEFIELGILKERDFDGLTTTQAETVIVEARRERKRLEDIARARAKEAEEAKKAAEAAEARRKAAEADRVKRQEEERQAREREREAEKARKAAEAEERRASAARDREAREAAKRKAEDAERRRVAAEKDRWAKEAAKNAADEEERKAERERKIAEKAQRDNEAAAAKKRAEASTSASAVGQGVSRDLKDHGYGTRDAGARADKHRTASKEKGPPPRLNEGAEALGVKINKILLDGDEMSLKLAEIVEYRDQLDPRIRKNLAANLRTVGDRFHEYADDLETAEPELKTVRVSRRQLPAS